MYLDRVVWHYIPDPWEAAEGLAAGELAWWQEPQFDFIAKIGQYPDLQTFVIDPQGTQGWLSPNWLHPPFNNQKARQALLHAMDQATFLAWANGQSQYYRTCYSVFPCGTAYATAELARMAVDRRFVRIVSTECSAGQCSRPR